MAASLWLGLVSLVEANAAAIIDVRTAEEFQSWHVKGALNIDHEEITDGILKYPDIRKDTPIHLYCRSGRRSGIARESLLKVGYKHVVNVGGLEEAGRFVDAKAD